MTGRVTAYQTPAGAEVERAYTWPVATLAEGRRNLRGLARQGVRAELVRADGQIERQAGASRREAKARAAAWA